MKSFKLEKDGADNDTNNSIGVGILGLILLGSGAWYFWGGGLEQQTSQGLDNIYKQVSVDSVQKYEIAKRQGDKIQICVQAGLVSASYLQEKNETEYQKWKAIEKSDCSSAGLNY
jgi:hypothetical protein